MWKRKLEKMSPDIKLVITKAMQQLFCLQPCIWFHHSFDLWWSKMTSAVWVKERSTGNHSNTLECERAAGKKLRKIILRASNLLQFHKFPVIKSGQRVDHRSVPGLTGPVMSAESPWWKTCFVLIFCGRKLFWNQFSTYVSNRRWQSII